MKKIGLVFALLLVSATARAVGPENCVGFNITGTSESSIVQTGQWSAPWTAYNQEIGCTGVGSANIKVYGACLDNASPCHRGPGVPLVAPTPSVDGTTKILTGPGSLEAISIVPVAVPTAAACIGGTNDAAACASASVCPGGQCGPCTARVVFCGINQGMNPGIEQ